MVKHIIMWNYKEALTDEEKCKKAKEAKAQLEGLKKIIGGLLKIEVIINPLNGSNADILLICEFDSIEALSNYQTHPEHKKVACFIKDNFTDRRCMDFKED